MKHSTRPVHPISGRRIRLRASSARELEAYRYQLDRLRTELRLEVKTPAEVDRAMRRMRFGVVTLEKAALSYIGRARLSPTTRDNVRGLLEGRMRALARLPLEALDQGMVSSWIDELVRSGDLEESTIDNMWRRLRAIVAHASERGWIGGAPWGLYKPKLKRRSQDPREAARSVSEFVRLLYAARDLDCEHWSAGDDPGDREAMIACAGLLALRQGELAGLRWTDIDPGPPLSILVGRQWNGRPLKGGATPVRLETIPELGEILATYRSRLELCELFDPRGPVFPWRQGSTRGRPVHYVKGEPLSRRNVRAAALRAGLPNVGAWSAHSLRDTFVTLESQATGGDLPRVAARSRHASLASLARYLRQLSRHTPTAPAIVKLPGRSDAFAVGAPREAHALPPPKETPH